jgi:lambda family phage portal protein
MPLLDTLLRPRASAARTAVKAPRASGRPSEAEQIATLRSRLDKARRQNRGMESRYDAAQTNDENRNHWGNADGLSATAANNHGVRWKLRTRSRYERANNAYAKGLIKTRTTDTVGVGPRLQLELPEEFTDPDFQTTVAVGTAAVDPTDLARQVEQLFCDWCERTHFNDKIRILADAEDGDGEGFALFVNNHALPEGTPQIDLRVIECDRIHTPDLVVETATQIDGVVLDEIGNPVLYHVLKRHPGDTYIQFSDLWSYDQVPARNVVHLFESDRPEQKRGIPILAPSLPLYAILRRYTLAELGRAELAAMISGVIENDNAPPDPSGENPVEIEAMDKIPFARGALLTLLGGQKAKAFEPAQPAFGPSFKADVLTECGRAANTPRNVSTGSSAEYNFSSGRLDMLPYQRGLRCRRERYERILLDRVFRYWLAEAQLIPGYLPAGLPPVSEWQWEWRWDGFDFIDPTKEATANQTLLATGQTTLKRVCAERGEHWVDVLKQRAREKSLAAKLGLDTPVPPAGAPMPSAKSQADTADQEEPANAA